jgi:origin recognition complex subunit 2
MPRRKQTTEPNGSGTAMRVSTHKRTLREAENGDGPDGDGVGEAAVDPTPPKRKRGRPKAAPREDQDTGKDGGSVYDFPSEDNRPNPAGTPTSRRTKGLPSAAMGDDAANHGSATPRNRKAAEIRAAETPKHAQGGSLGKGETPRWRRNDRSARKKSARALIESVVAGNTSDDDDQDIAREIYESSDDEDNENLEEDEDAPQEDLTATPSKKPRGWKRGPATRTRKKSPTPLRDLPPHELYFAQNRPGGSKTSGNNLTSLQLLTHEEYFSLYNNHQDPHHDDVGFLEDWHAESFPQWAFELSQGFSACLYGFGAKRPLLHKFAKHVYNTIADHSKHKIVIINGYVRNTSIRELLGTVGSAVDPSYKPPAGNPSAMLDDLKLLMSSHHVSITIVLNSIDALPMRRAGLQAIFAQLAANPGVQLICSADTPDFPLLWDSGLRSAFNFVFHDCTTFSPFTTEIDVVDEVHELLGRKARRVGGKEGVTYVLRSLPENAKNLFRLLVTEVLVAMDDEGVSGGENPGIEYRMLYGKAVEEFICSSEMAFRTLLKE